MEIVFVTENRYFNYTKTTLISAIENTSNTSFPERFNIWVISQDELDNSDFFIEKIKRDYNSKITIVYSKVEKYEGFYTPLHISLSA
ncbi:lipopolysaccharide biosynthesis glycosyltransferase [Sporosarcina luteola]|nr:lipopolysaccharide biosynthesis glycosyltransferase [Sporosarcina luteola]